MTLLLAHSVMYKGGLPSRICDAAHTSKFMITTGADGALCIKQRFRELLNRLTGLIGHWEYSRNWDFTSTTISKFKTMWSTTSKSVIQSTYDFLSLKFGSEFQSLFIGPRNFQTGFAGWSGVTGINLIMACQWMKKKFQLFIITGDTNYRFHLLVLIVDSKERVGPD